MLIARYVASVINEHYYYYYYYYYYNEFVVREYRDTIERDD